MIETPARDALALRLVLREPAADACAAAFVRLVPDASVLIAPTTPAGG